jgi:hypothetical protein
MTLYFFIFLRPLPARLPLHRLSVVDIERAAHRYLGEHHQCVIGRLTLLAS